MKDRAHVRSGLFLTAAVLGSAASLVVALFGAPAALAASPTGAVFTTTNPAADNGATGSPVLCLNGNPGSDGPNFKPAINCNIYTNKSYVWLTGGPGPSALSAGTYFFAVLVPGGQPDPNDGGLKNLSDQTAAPWPTGSFNEDLSPVPSGDSFADRTFTTDGHGNITYHGPHDFSNNEIRLMPYDDTTNEGGVYIMAVCSLASRYPVDAKDCKYDAFKVRQQVPLPVGLTVSKDASGSLNRTYTWGITKSVDKTEIDQSATSATFNYTVSVTHDSGTDSGWAVNGTIDVFNPNVNSDGSIVPVNDVTVTDAVNDANASCAVSGGSDVTISDSSQSFGYSCSYSAAPANSSEINTVTVSWLDQNLVIDGTSEELAAGSSDFSVDFDFAANLVDNCVAVTDTLGGPLGTVCSTDPSPKLLTYSHSVDGTAGTCTSVDNTATFTTNTSGTTGSDSKTVKLCVGKDLGVSKTATPSFTRTYNWEVSKSVDQSSQDIAAGGSATFNYTVIADETGFADSGWAVNGTITVTNPNDWEAISANLSDAVDDGGTCAVAGGGTVTLPASSSATVGYSCSYSSQPAYSAADNTVTAAWDGGAASTPDSTAADTVGFTFNDGSAGNPTRVNQVVTLSDSVQGVLGTLTAVDTTPYTSATYTYSNTVSGTPGTCKNYSNIATILETSQTASLSATLCVGADLAVSKTATPAFTRNYGWNITKAVDKTLVEQIGGTATFNYTVVASETGFTDSGWTVNGTITVSNPNDWEAISANVSDAVNDGGSCTVAGGGLVTVPKSGSASLGYTCSYASQPAYTSATNTATASWDNVASFTPDGSASGGASFLFNDGSAGNPTRVNQVITVTDTFNGATTTLGTLTATDSGPLATQTFTYPHTVNVPAANCVKYPNTAVIVQTGQNASKTVEVCGPAATGALTMGFWQNKNGQGIIGGANQTNLGNYLRQYHPFSDAPSSGLAAYVSNIIKAATCSTSATCNSMLRAQMLSTALDVYFSDPALGGNKIGASGPIGGVSIDLTKICAMIDGSGGSTCSGSFENVSSVFGGATSLTVSQMLAYQNTSDPAADAGANWYGQVKAKQVLAKDAFDAINNQVAFSP